MALSSGQDQGKWCREQVIKWMPVESSAFRAEGYDEDKHVLYLRFGCFLRLFLAKPASGAIRQKPSAFQRRRWQIP